MKKIAVLSCVLLLSLGVLLANDSVDTGKARIFGDYLEVRTSDVWTGPCFANGEVNLTGREALMAWEVKGGQWQDVALEGLRVVAVLRASSTLGDPFSEQLPAKSVILVDSRASAEQSEALADFARTMGGELLESVVWVRSAPIKMDILAEKGHASLQAGELVELKTRALNHHDMHCGNEFVYYPPLTDVASAAPAYTLAHRFSGEGLGSTWSCPSKRSAFIGTFAR